MHLINLFGFFALVVNFSTKIWLFLYTDPGSGAMLWQMLTIFFFSAMFYVIFAFQKVKKFVSKMFGLTDKQQKVITSQENISEN